jgi:hypothetical protein
MNPTSWEVIRRIMVQTGPRRKERLYPKNNRSKKGWGCGSSSKVSDQEA